MLKLLFCLAVIIGGIFQIIDSAEILGEEMKTSYETREQGYEI